MTRLPTTSVVIPTHNRPELLERCLGALAKQTLTPAQVIVVDDASRPETGDLLRRCAAGWPRPGGLVFVRMRTNRGPAAARNAGVSMARSEFVAFTDDDCVAEPTWLEELTKTLTTAPMDFAGIGGRVLSAAPGLIGEYMVFHRILEPPESCSYLVTANCIYQRAVVVEAGGFDETVRHAGGEDPGLSVAITRLGYRLGYCERAVVRHHFRESIIDFARTFFRYGQGCHHVMG